MKDVRSSALIVISLLALCTSALPRPNPSPTYAVVNVGGSNAAPNGASIETVSIFSTVTETPAPSTITEPAVTITAAPAATPTETESVTTTQAANTVAASTALPAWTPSSASAPLPPLPTLAPAAPPSAPSASEAGSIYITNTVPGPLAQNTPITSFATLNGAFTQPAAWNETVIEVTAPASLGSGLAFAAVATGSPLRI